MPNDKNTALKALHDLAATSNDAAEGYAKAAKGVRDRELSDWLAHVSDDRQRFASDIVNALAQLGGHAGTDLHEGGILHRGWVDLEQSLRPKDDSEILGECIAGDSGTLKHYDHALQQDLPDPLRALLTEQRAAVQRDLSTLDRSAHRHKAHHA